MNSSGQPRWPFSAAVAAAIAGTSILAFCFALYWPASSWIVTPRAALIARSRQVAEHFGLIANGWKTSAAPHLSRPLAYYQQQHPHDASGSAVSPLSLRCTFTGKGDDNQVDVWLDSAASPLRWHAPDGFKPKAAFPSERAAANDALAFLAGPRAPSFGVANRSTGEDLDEKEYLWKKPPAPHSDARENIKVVTRGPAVRSAERSLELSSEDDEGGDNGNNHGYWNAIDVSFWLICASTMTVAAAIYVLWLVRKVVSHKFPFRIAGAAFLVMLAALTAGSIPDKFGASFTAIFQAAIIVCLSAVGRGISATARPKWLSLEQLCRLAPVAKSTGVSLAAGLLCSPLLLSIPFLIAACSWSPRTYVLASRAEVLYSPAPLLDSISIGGIAYLLGFFGFGLPALHRIVRARWLRWLILLPLGALYFADLVNPVVTGPPVVPLLASLSTLAVFGFLYRFFDLLAVLTLQVSAGLLLSILTLLQKGFSAWSPIAAFGLIAAVAYGLYLRGRLLSEGDPLATIPALAGFRAEREKLKAEFSVARRAQQDMLPQSAPHIPGYSIAASCTPSLEVGGDLYDFLKLPDGRFGIGVADVSGKGVPAALYMTLTKGLLASIAKNNSHLATVVEEVNRHLHGVTRKKVFVTMALGFLDAEKRVLQCVRAGHNPVVWRQPSQDLTTLVSPRGLGLGITAGKLFNAQLQVAEMALTEGDAVVFYSDGITEAMNSGLEQFGEQRLMDAVQKADRLDAAAARDSILQDVKDFLAGVHPQDDITLVVLRVGVPN